MNLLVRSLLISAALAAGTSSTWAHSIWFAQRAGDLALVYGHGAEDLSVIKRLDKITAVGGYDASGQPVAVALKPTDHLAFVNLESKPAVVWATLDNGLWTQTQDGKWVNRGKDETPTARHSGRYLKYSLHLQQLPTGAVPPLPQPGVQLIPIGPRFPQHAGEPLTLRVLLNGKPMAGVPVWADTVNDPDGAPVKTRADGTVRLKVRNQGLNVIKAEFSTAPDDPARADKTEHSATLSFVLAHQPE